MDIERAADDARVDIERAADDARVDIERASDDARVDIERASDDALNAMTVPDAIRGIAAPTAPARVLLTGATGFLGKVVLAQLVAEREALGIERIRLLVRKKRGALPRARFATDIATSPCFAGFPAGWVDVVDVTPCELANDGCELDPADRAAIEAETTHIVHCAASVEFDLPIEKAAAANIASALNVLELARGVRGLVAMTSVSTAYVSPHPGQGVFGVDEALAKLPWPASEAYARILAGGAEAKSMLEEAGLPNTYTLTKCLAEHLLVERAGDVPLAIVRPSIISAAWKRPFPGWIDSDAAFAAFVMVIGSGHFRTLRAHPETALDVVPVYEVSERVVRTRFGGVPESGTVAIRHAVAGLDRTLRVDECCAEITRYFRRDPLERLPRVHHIGPRGVKFSLFEALHHTWPMQWRERRARRQGDKEEKKKLRILGSTIAQLNRAFPYFTHHTFDFRTQEPPLADRCPGGAAYIQRVCRGTHEHLLRGKLDSTSLAGRKHRHDVGDWAWMWSQPRGGPMVRVFGLVLRKAFRRFIDQVTFDRKSFEAARVDVLPDSFCVILPNHRSYLDFLLLSFLFFERPDLGISIPKIAAADEFRRIPILGRLFRRAGAFYVQRGHGREDPDLTEQIRQLVVGGHTLQFFIEGTRSRSRQFLPPKRGLLRALQQTGQHCTLLPIALSYDRLPEEASFIEELSGGAKARMSIVALLRWCWRMFWGRIDLGRIHIRCGRPLELDGSTDIHELGRRVIGELQAAQATTTHHLRCLLAHHPIAGVDFEWLAGLIRARGGLVIESELGGEEAVDRSIERTLRHQWLHLFCPDVLARVGDHPVLVHFARQSCHDAPPRPAAPPVSRLAGHDQGPAFDALLYVLFAPVCDDYAATARAAAELAGELGVVTVDALRARLPTMHEPTLGAAVEWLVGEGVLVAVDEASGYAPGPALDSVQALARACAWPGGAPAPALGAREVPATVATGVA